MCARDDASQQWIMFEANGYSGFRNIENDECMSRADSLIGPWDVITEPCDDSRSEQQWAIEPYDQGGHDPQWPVRLHNQANNFCLYTDFTGWVYGTVANCGLLGTDAGRKVGIYFGGRFLQRSIRPVAAGSPEAARLSQQSPTAPQWAMPVSTRVTRNWVD